MNLKQIVFKVFYPALMWFSKKAIKNDRIIANTKTKPITSFYQLRDEMISGGSFDFSQLKGKKVLLVNTASECGYTAQFEGLEKLSNKFAEKLVVLGFPSNEFKNQEKGDDESIAAFCKKNYGVSFRLMKKNGVIRSGAQNKVYKWLTDSGENGWNNKTPSWNFCKYLVDENGALTHFFDTSVAPLDAEIIGAINTTS